MKLFDALQETGKAVSRNGDVETLAEYLADEKYLVMTRRGVTVLGCRMMSREEIEQELASSYGYLAMQRDWCPAYIQIVHTKCECMRGMVTVAQPTGYISLVQDIS